MKITLAKLAMVGLMGATLAAQAAPVMGFNAEPMHRRYHDRRDRHDHYGHRHHGHRGHEHGHRGRR